VRLGRATAEESTQCGVPGHPRNGQDIGASVAVLIDGEPVIDLWGGYFDDPLDLRGKRAAWTATISALSVAAGASQAGLNYRTPER
jgi:hypothetical protein